MTPEPITEEVTEAAIAEFKRLRDGVRLANHAAFYAHVRTMLAGSLSDEDPVVGFHGIVLLESQRYYAVSAGGTPELPSLLSMLARIQGDVLERAIARAVGDKAKAGQGDQFNPALGKTQCISCETGDPDGSHADEELRENAKAFLGLVVAVATKFYGPYLSYSAKAAVKMLALEALPAGSDIS